MVAYFMIRMRLIDFSFTNNADNAISETRGWYLYYTTIDAFSGDDTIIGKTKSFGSGIDVLEGIINTSDGNDTIIGVSKGTGIALDEGSINTGNGNDIIKGVGKNDGIALFKSTINTGSGKDIVDALEGGFGGGEIYLGAGNDTLRGFGTGKFYGETGKDKIFFDAGKYKINGSIVRHDGENMRIYEFEKIGGINGGLFDFKDGALTVDSMGVGTFA